MNEVYKLSHCPCCLVDVEKSEAIFESTMFKHLCLIRKCSSCGLIYKEFFPTIIGLNKIYSSEYTHFHDSGEWKKKSYYNSAKQKLDSCRKFSKKNRSINSIRILDVGCGSGDFVAVARDIGYAAYGIDPHIPLHSNISYLQRKKIEEVETASFDIVVMLNVAEHLVHPRDFFTEICRVLVDDGILLLTCPYGNSLARRFYGKRWNHLVLDEHLLFWTPKSLSILLRQVGFHGDHGFRIAGTPFPWGRISATEVDRVAENESTMLAEVAKLNKADLKKYVIQASYYIQSHEKIANFVRYIVHHSSTGDYLEYAIAKN